MSLDRARGTQRRLEAELRSSAERFRQTFDDAPSGVALVAPDRRLLTVNRAMCEMLGYPESELVGRTLEGITHPDDLPRDVAAVEAMVSGEAAVYRTTKRYIHRSGRVIHVKISSRLVRSADGAPSHLVSHIEDVTATAEAEHAAREARRLLDESQAIAGTGSWSFKLDTREVSWSDGQFRLHGLEPGPIAPTPEEYDELLHPDDRAAVQSSIESLMADPRSFEGEYRVVHPDGSVHSLRTSAGVLAADPTTGRPARVSGTTRDVTAEREAEARRRSVEQRHRRLLSSLPDTMVVLYDPRLRCLLMQGGLVQALDIDTDRYIGRELAQITSPEHHAILEPGLTAALAGQSQTIELHDVGGHSFQVQYAPYLDDHGKITGALTVWRDVTARLRRERENRMLITMVEQSEDAIIAKDKSGTIIEWNRGAERLYGYSREEAVGRSIALIIPPERAGEDRELLGRALAGQSAQLDTVRQCKDGGRVSVSISVSPLHDAAGTVIGASVIARDVGERKRFEGKLRHLADHDALTGLFNRRRFASELERALSRAARHRQPGALLMIDLDGFKHVNDTLGHSFGDELITRVGTTLREALRETDVVGRLGGDEFAVILDGVGAEQAMGVAEKLRDAVEEHGVVGDQAHGVTASLGVVPFGVGRRLDADQLLLEADLAMYRAKDAGKNQLAIAQRDSVHAPALSARRSWHTRLRAALDHDRFELFAQPIQGICAPGVARFELLLRLREDDLGELISPGMFLYNAERCDLIQEIDRWVFCQALELLRAHHEAGIDIGLSVNMSGKTLSDPTIIDDLRAMVTACPIPAGRLIVEVTETAAIVNIEQARDVARALRLLGCRFALDDFGAGFASFYYLKHLEFDYVKIDGEFVKALGSNPTDPLVIRSVVDIARGLGAETIAEFVGDEAAVHRLRELGVDYGQGYHLGRPQPVGEVLPTPV